MTAERRVLSDSDILHKLHGANLRPSVHRMAVMAYVANNRTHPTAEEIYGKMAQDFPNVSKTTIYNSLHVLTSAGILRELEIESGSTRYDMADYKPHAHFTCKKCGRIYDMPLPEELATLVTEGFEAETAELYFKGLCPDCKNN